MLQVLEEQTKTWQLHASSFGKTNQNLAASCSKFWKNSKQQWQTFHMLATSFTEVQDENAPQVEKSGMNLGVLKQECSSKVYKEAKCKVSKVKHNS